MSTYYLYWYSDESYGLSQFFNLDEVKAFIAHERIKNYALIKGDLVEMKGVDHGKLH